MYCCEDNKVNIKAKLLVIDDDKHTRMLIRDVLDGTDIPVIESDCGKQALDLFKELREEIGLILLDIYLPDCDGWTLGGMIRQVSPQVPVIAISAIFPAELAAKYRTAGFTGYITKPFEMNRLKEIIVSYLHSPANR